MQKLKLFITAVIFCTLILQAETYTPDKAYQQIIKKGTLKIGISEHYPPLNFEGKKGLEFELAKGLADFLGVKPVFIQLKITEYVPSIQNGAVDIVIAGMSSSIERGKKIWFSEPYLTVTPAMLVNNRYLPRQSKPGEEFERVTIRTIWDLSHLNYLTVAVKKGSSYVDLLKNQMPDMKPRYIDTNNEGFKLLSQGSVNGFIHDSLYLEYMYKKDTKLQNICTLLSGGKQVEKICAGLPFGDIVLKNQVDSYLKEIERTGLIVVWLKKFNEVR